MRVRYFEEPYLAGAYWLEHFESGQYYVRGPVETQGGVTFDGTIQQIGWTDRSILARVTRIYRGDSDGWYALNVSTGEIRGPLSESDIASDESLSGIRCHPPGQW
jgi:hypothetical protein